MEPLLIKYALRTRGLSVTDVARKCRSAVTGQSISEKSVRAVIDGDSRSARIERLIATLLELPIHVLWPQWYAADGSKIKQRRKTYASTAEIIARLNAMRAAQEAA